MGTAYRGPFPIPGHRTMAQVMLAETKSADAAGKMRFPTGEHSERRMMLAGSMLLLRAIQAARP